MARFQSNGRGSTGIKVKYRGVPEIRRATGTNDGPTLDAIETMLDALYQTGRTDVLEAIARGRLHILAVLPRWRAGETLPTAEVLPFLGLAWDDWARTLKASDGHRANICSARRALKIPHDATLAELPALLADYKRHCADKASTFNHVRAYAQAFARDTVGVSHPIYARLRDVRPMPKRARTRGQPHSVHSIRELAQKLGPTAGLMVWTLAATGMGPKEYWSDGFEVLIDRLLIKGQKRASRERMIPRWTLVTGPTLSLRVFRQLVKDASGGTVSVYDLRRSFSRWTEEAGIIETNRDAYMGHGPRTMGQLYSWGQLPGQLTNDAGLLARYAGEDSPAALMEVRA